MMESGPIFRGTITTVVVVVVVVDESRGKVGKAMVVSAAAADADLGTVPVEKVCSRARKSAFFGTCVGVPFAARKTQNRRPRRANEVWPRPAANLMERAIVRAADASAMAMAIAAAVQTQVAKTMTDSPTMKGLRTDHPQTPAQTWNC